MFLKVMEIGGMINIVNFAKLKNLDEIESSQAVEEYKEIKGNHMRFYDIKEISINTDKIYKVDQINGEEITCLYDVWLFLFNHLDRHNKMKGQGKGQDNDQQDHGHGRSDAHFQHGETVLVDHKPYNPGGLTRASSGHYQKGRKAPD